MVATDNVARNYIVGDKSIKLTSPAAETNYRYPTKTFSAIYIMRHGGYTDVCFRTKSGTPTQFWQLEIQAPDASNYFRYGAAFSGTSPDEMWIGDNADATKFNPLHHVDLTKPDGYFGTPNSTDVRGVTLTVYQPLGFAASKPVFNIDGLVSTGARFYALGNSAASQARTVRVYFLRA